MSFSGKDASLPSWLRGFESRHPLQVTSTLHSVAEDARPFRLVWRVDQNRIELWPGVISEPCSRCGAMSYLDSNQPSPPGMEDAALICAPCAYADPDLRPEVIRICRQVRAASSMGRATDS